MKMMKSSRRRSSRPSWCVTLCGAISALALASPLVAFENQGRDYEEDSDAGDTPDTSQKVILDAFSTVKTIKGELKGDQDSALAGDGNPPPDLQDVYEVVIKDPGVFKIQTTPQFGSTEFDSMLAVYDAAGFALLANEDAKPDVLGSRVGNQSTEGGFTIDEPGAIYISISGAASRPVTGQNAQVFAFTQNSVDVVGPSAAGQESPFAGWVGGNLKQVGSYVIELTSVSPFPSNCGVENTSSCFEVHPIPYCDNDVCCVAVCTVNPFCCEVTWDENCVAFANDLCNGGEGGCGSPGTESCYVVHESPYCDFAPCCALVCQAIPDCCLFNWAPECVDAALKFCPANCNFDCPADLNFDGVVSGPDLAIMLGAWRQDGCADINGDGEVTGADLAVLLGQWGDCFN